MLLTKAQRATLNSCGAGNLPASVALVLIENHARVLDFFRFANADADFHISRDELQDALVGILKLELSAESVDELFDVIDTNHDNVIELQELSRALHDAIPEEDRAQRQPSPTAKPMPRGRSTFGQQASSQRRSAPAFGFGVSTRLVASKVFVSQEHTALATDAIERSPGPAKYSLPPSVGGKQPDGRKRDVPVWRFGTSAARLQASHETRHHPSPATYRLQPALGSKQALSRMRSEPTFAFGSAERQHVRKVFISQAHQKTELYGTSSPGPQAAYKMSATVGGAQPLSRHASQPRFSLASKARPPDNAGPSSPGPHAVGQLPAAVGQWQPDSTRERAPTPSFGASTREQRSKLFVSQEHTLLACFGSQSPSKWYEAAPAMGKQVSSKRPSRPSSAFARAPRWAEYEREMRRNSTPGPGSYD